MMEIELWSIDRPVPYSKNPRKIPQTAIDKVAASIREFGWRQPIVVDAAGVIVVGHTRLLAARKLSLLEVPVHVAADLSEAQCRAYRIADNRANEEASWDAELLRIELGELGDMAAELTAFDPSELERFGPAPTLQDPEPQIDKAGGLKVKWGTALGQLWQVGPHRLLCADCRDEAAVGRLWANGAPSLRMVWTDPPYGVSYGEKTAWMEQHGAQKTRRVIENDNLKPAELQALFAGALKAAAVHAEPGAAIYATVPSVYLKFFIQGMEDGGFSYKHQLVWVKQSLVMGRSDYHYKHEPVLYGWIESGAHYFTDDRTQHSVFEVDRPSVSDLHPTTKPVALIARMVANSSRPGELVYDPFCGSGSTLLAAHQLDRIGYGVELSPEYVAVILERFAALDVEARLIGREDVEHEDAGAANDPLTL